MCSYRPNAARAAEEAIRSMDKQSDPSDQSVNVIDHVDGLEWRVRATWPRRVLGSENGPGRSGARDTGGAPASRATLYRFVSQYTSGRRSTTVVAELSGPGSGWSTGGRPLGRVLPVGVTSGLRGRTAPGIPVPR
jgi:hypothetical protein